MAKTLSETYRRFTTREHVLERPDSYVGSVQEKTAVMWVRDAGAESTLVQRSITFVPALLKLMDELLMNATDARLQDETITRLDVTVEENRITVRNNGKGIPIEMHEEYGVYIPQLIFGEFMTSSNYDDTQVRKGAGRNGLGAKCAGVFSTLYSVEVVDPERGKKFTMEWRNNMSVAGKAKVISSSLKTGYVSVSFEPDHARLSNIGLTADVVSLLRRRALDVAGTVKGLKVYFNGEVLTVPSFKRYCELYGSTDLMMDPDPSESWQVGVALAPQDAGFQHVSFVNGLNTTLGGTHVDAVVNTLCFAVVKHLEKKKVNVRPGQIKPLLWVFVNATLPNPSFDSQSKTCCTLAQKNFGTQWTPSEAFLSKICKSSIVETLSSKAKEVEKTKLARTDGSKTARISGFPDLDDANWAGTKNSNQCTLILTEGKSAKALALAGLSAIENGRDTYGVFPLRGVPLNVREATVKQIMENEEITAIKRIMGLKEGTEYTSTDKLRYGHLMIMSDFDHDGSKIRGLIISFFESSFPSLLRIPGFLLEFITPIVKATRGKETRSFFTLTELNAWRATLKETWSFKHFKGLGTSTSVEGKEYFRNIDRHQKRFSVCDEQDSAALDLVYNKKRADDRKQWLADFVPGTFLDHSVPEIKIYDFVHRDLIHYSIYANQRAIPSVIDGLKPGQRKILYGCFKRNLTDEMKVAQLGAYVAEVSCYHHGEVSLEETIVGMAQDWVGSNNLNLLTPRGQFGTRHQGGKDHASARYIFTCLRPWTRLVFREEDDAILTYLDDEGSSVEPDHYTPIIPMLLVNGCEGIGVGWSSSVPAHDPVDVLKAVRARLTDEQNLPLTPHTRGWVGRLESLGGKYKTHGTWSLTDETTLDITELPLGRWTQSLKEDLEKMLQDGDIKDFKEQHTEQKVHFIITLAKPIEDIEAKFKLASTLTTTNMVCFNADGRLQKYNSADEIIDAFMPVRHALYEKRHAYMLDRLRTELARARAKARFVVEVSTGALVLSGRRTASDIHAELASKKYPKVDDDYKYLLSMPLWSLTDDKVAALESERDALETRVRKLESMTPKDLWLADLDALEPVIRQSGQSTTSTTEVITRKSATPRHRKSKV